ncbi:winged helix-turn-helix transcriptional regulator [Nocardiopsis sp. LOL_012]|uniref:winged helix-turn-helix transcriptional regulator n=1 Tax=Nocardiopsis sp. LOL_012 TaxID=3345409 RepID=UPI003A83F712
MAARRTYGSYNDGCASAHALDLIGERWALIVVRELLLGPKRFADLQRDIPGIGPTALTHRLNDLESAGVALRRTLPSPARVAVYDLTDWGRGLEAVNAALSLWAVGSPRLPRDADMSPDTLVLAMRAHARPLPPGARAVRVALELADPRALDREPVGYSATVTAHGTSIAKEPADAAVDAVVRTTTRAWKPLVLGSGRLDASVGVQVEGDIRAARALVDAVRLEPG